MRAPENPRHARSRRRLLIAAGVAATILASVVTAAVLLVGEVAVKASKGAECPNCGAYGWLDSMGYAYWDDDGELHAEKLAASDQRSELLKQRRTYIHQIQADIRHFPLVASTDFDSFEYGQATTTTHGDSATVTLKVAARWLQQRRPHIPPRHMQLLHRRRHFVARR